MSHNQRIARSVQSSRRLLLASLPHEVRVAYAVQSLFRREDLVPRTVTAFSTDKRDLEIAFQDSLRRAGAQNLYPDIPWGQIAVYALLKMARAWKFYDNIDDRLDFFSNVVTSMITGRNILSGNTWKLGTMGEMVKAWHAEGLAEEEVRALFTDFIKQKSATIARAMNRTREREQSVDGMENPDLLGLLGQVRQSPDLRIMLQEMTNQLKRRVKPQTYLVWQALLHNPDARYRELEMTRFVPQGQSGPARTLEEWQDELYPVTSKGETVPYGTQKGQRTKYHLGIIKDFLHTAYPAFADGFGF